MALSPAEKSRRRRARNPERARAEVREYKARNRERLRAYDREYHADPTRRGRCRTCGGLMGIRRVADGTCRSCRMAAAAERRQRIVAWWAEGLTPREIAERVGWSVSHVGVEMTYMRRLGYELPYRYAGRVGRRSAS